MKNLQKLILLSLLAVSCILIFFPITNVNAANNSTPKKSSINLHIPTNGNLSVASINHYTPLKSYYKKALKKLKKENPKLKSEELYGKAYLSGYEDYINKYLERIIAAYEKKGWTVPAQNLEVYILLGIGDVAYQNIDAAHSNKSSLTIYTNYSSFEKLQHDIAHETFHWFQSVNSSLILIERNRWQKEMLADYAPRYAALRSDKYVGEGIRQDFLKYPLTYDPEINDRHKYQTAQLLKYIDKKAETFDLNLFWLNLANGANEDGILRLERSVLTNSGKSLLYYYRYFASYLLFSPSSPVVFSEAASHSIALRDPSTNGLAKVSLFNFQSTGVQTNLMVSENYSAELWALPVNFHSSMKKTQRLSLRSSQGMTPRTAIDVYKSTSNYQAAKRVATILDGNSEVSFSVKNGDKLYIVAVNGENQPKNFSLSLTNNQ